MDFSPEEEATAVGALAGQVLEDHSSHEKLRELERSGRPRFDSELWSKLAETGVLGAFIPEDHGGAGLDLVALGAVLDHVGRTAAAVPIWETFGLAVPAIAEFAPSALTGEVLAKVATGESILTTAWHESDSEPLAPVTLAARDGDGWVISGTKTCVPAGQVADAVLVPCSVRDGSVGLFLVDTASDGITVEALTTTLGDPQAEIRFADAPARLVAEGRESLRWAYERGVATLCSMAVGNSAEALRLTAQYAKDRKQFDVPIASFQAVAHRLADSFVDTEAIRLTAQQALWRLSVGMHASAEVSSAKYWAAVAGQRVVHTAQHVHGGVGVDRDYPLHRHFLAAKEIELQLGGATRQLLDLGKLIATEAV